jgi:hypothetical protein
MKTIYIAGREGKDLDSELNVSRHCLKKAGIRPHLTSRGEKQGIIRVGDGDLLRGLDALQRAGFNASEFPTSCEDLTPEIMAEFTSFCRIVDGEIVGVADKDGLLRFLSEHIEKYPSLRHFFDVNEEALVRYVEETGEVPPGVVLTKRTRPDEKVTEVEVLRGPMKMKDPSG